MSPRSPKNTDKEFERLYFDHYSFLCQHIYRFVNDSDIARDIVQEVFVKYWQKVAQSGHVTSPLAYLRSACIRQALNHIKEVERRTIREQAFSEESQSEAKIQRPDRKLEVKEVAVAINKAIAELPNMCRTAFLLSRYEEKSYKEIADQLSISVNTVEKHIGKALRNLREALSKNR